MSAVPPKPVVSEAIKIPDIPLIHTKDRLLKRWVVHFKEQFRLPQPFLPYTYADSWGYPGDYQSLIRKEVIGNVYFLKRHEADEPTAMFEYIREQKTWGQSGGSGFHKTGFSHRLYQCTGELRDPHAKLKRESIFVCIASKLLMCIIIL